MERESSRQDNKVEGAYAPSTFKDMPMEMNQLGMTGLRISRLGLGLAQGKHKLTMDDFQDASDVLDVALEACSEERRGAVSVPRVQLAPVLLHRHP